MFNSVLENKGLLSREWKRAVILSASTVIVILLGVIFLLVNMIYKDSKGEAF